MSYEAGDVIFYISKGSRHLLNKFRDTHVKICFHSPQDMKRKIREFAQRREHSRYDSCVVAIMSHGIARRSKQDSTIISADGQLLEIEWVLEQFTNENARSLVAKPKIFFFQTCRCDMAFKLVI